jgi:hypothetical protein
MIQALEECLTNYTDLVKLVSYTVALNKDGNLMLGPYP